MSNDKGVDKKYYIYICTYPYTMVYYSAVTKDEPLPFGQHDGTGQDNTNLNKSEERKIWNSFTYM